MSAARQWRPAARSAGGDRRDAGVAALGSALLHLGAMWWAMTATPPIVTADPQGASGGSPLVVTYVGLAPPQVTDSSTPAPAMTPDATPEPADQPARPTPTRLRTTPGTRADVPPPAPPSAAASAPARGAAGASIPAAPATTDTPRDPRHVWGQPPGLGTDAQAPVHAGQAAGPGTHQGTRPRASGSGPELEAGGYQVVYDLTSQTRLDAWAAQGVTEVFIPLPGTTRRMACPLEIARRRESGACRLVEPDDPALADMGDAREVMGFHQVYRRGTLLWRGPGAYR